MKPPTVGAALRRDSETPRPIAVNNSGVKPLLQKIRFLPWLLLAASLALNLYLWRSRATDSAHHHTPYSASAPTTHYQQSATTASSSVPPFNFPPSTFNSRSPAELATASTASRSSAFRGYADLLAEDIKTQEQLAALNQLLSRWVATDPTAAATWLSHYDDAPFYDPAALHVANHLVATQRFAEATAWADLIRDPALREDALDAVIAESFRAKKIDASAVRLSGLPAPRVEAILNGSRLD